MKKKDVVDEEDQSSPCVRKIRTPHQEHEARVNERNDAGHNEHKTHAIDPLGGERPGLLHGGVAMAFLQPKMPDGEGTTGANWLARVRRNSLLSECHARRSPQTRNNRAMPTKWPTGLRVISRPPSGARSQNG